MTITVETRKRLWGRSGGRCAICRDELFFYSEAADVIIGEEAHIIAKSPKGPRREFATEATEIDGYGNLILLCRKDHVIADSDPATWTVQRLLDAKNGHEKWVRTLPPEQAKPTRILPGEDYWTKEYRPMISGQMLWAVLRDSHSYKFGQPIDTNDEEADFLASSFDIMKDWGEALSDVGTLIEQRAAERSLQEVVDEMAARSLVVAGRSVGLVLTGGVGPETKWMQAEVQAWRLHEFLTAAERQYNDPEA